MAFSDEEEWRGRMVSSSLVDAIITDPNVVRKGYDITMKRIGTLSQNTSNLGLTFDDLVDNATVIKYGLMQPLEIVASSVHLLDEGKPIDLGETAAALALCYISLERASSA